MTTHLKLLGKDTCGVGYACNFCCPLNHSLVCDARPLIRSCELKRCPWICDREVGVGEVQSSCGTLLLDLLFLLGESHSLCWLLSVAEVLPRCWTRLCPKLNIAILLHSLWN